MISGAKLIGAKQKPDFLSRLPNAHLFQAKAPECMAYGFQETPETWEEFLANKDQLASGWYSTGNDRSEFPYIAYSVKSFKDDILPLVKGAGSFIDVGCGAGDKLKIVSERYPRVRVYGVEHNPATAIWAGAYGTVFCTDAFKLDYSNYDIIYAYWPISNYKLMDKLIEHILATKRKSAIFALVGYSDQSKLLKRGKGFYYG